MAIQVAPENVIGRDKLIEQIWRKLKKNSLRFTAERRIGKTTVMTKMATEPKAGYEVLFMELEGIDSPDRFAELLLNRVRPLLSTTDQAKSWWDNFRDAIGGTEVAGVIRMPESKIGWQVTLEKTLEGVCDQNQDKTILLLMDELPYMLQKISTIQSADDSKTLALTLLDTLRSIRQQMPNLRMIFAGSIGLHHVVSDLKQAKLASEPMNDMPSIEIHSLSEPDAMLLVERLLADEAVCFAVTDANAIQKQIVELTDAVPFYIEAVCSRLSEVERQITTSDVEVTVLNQLTDDLDRWQMEHFRERLSIYYDGTVKDISNTDIPDDQIARAVLDHLALATEAQSINQVWSSIKSQFEITDRQHIVQMLKSLALDHYLSSDNKKCYSFRFPLIQSWWKKAQGLEE